MSRTTITSNRASSRDLGHLRHLLVFLRPYRTQLVFAALALIVAAGAVLGFGALQGGGRARLAAHGWDVEALVRVQSLEDGAVVLAGDSA